MPRTRLEPTSKSKLNSTYVLKSGDTMTGALTINATSTTALQVNQTGGGTNVLTVDSTNTRIGIGTTSPTNILSLSGQSARTFWMERHTTANTAGNSLTIQAGSATSAATDKAGGSIILKPGTSTGIGTQTALIQTAPRLLTGAITAIALFRGGTGYSVNDVLTVVYTGGSAATINVDTVDGSGVILTASLTAGGSGYRTSWYCGVTGGTGTLAYFNITVTATSTSDNTFSTVFSMSDQGVLTLTPSNLYESQTTVGLVLTVTQSSTQAATVAAFKITDTINMPNPLPANTGPNWYGEYVVVQTAADNNTYGNSQARSFTLEFDHAGTNTFNNAKGLFCDIKNISTGTVSNMQNAVSLTRNTSTGIVTTAYNFYSQAPINTGGGTIGTSYGYYNENMNVATTNYARWSAGGANVYLAGTATVNILQLRGASSQSGDTLQIQNSSSTVLTSISSAGIVNKYNNITTVSNGVPSEFATIDTTGLTANVGASTLYAVPASGVGMYRVSAYVVETTAGSISSTLPNVQLVFTDFDSNTSVTIDATPILGIAGIGQTGALTANTVGTISSGVIVINVKASTTIQYQTVNYASNLAGMAYALHIKLEAL